MTGAHDMPTDHNINTTGDMTMSTEHDTELEDHQVYIRDYREHLEARIGGLISALGEDDEEAASEAQAEMETMNLGSEFSLQFRVILGVFGPTTYLTANIALGEHGSFERISNVTLYHSWGVPRTEIEAWDDEAIAYYFDLELEKFDGSPLGHLPGIH